MVSGSAMFTVSATALLFRVVDGGSRGRATGLFQSGFLIGGLLGPLVGGFLTEYSLRLPFFVYAVSLIAAGIDRRGVPAGHPLRAEAATPPSARQPRARRPARRPHRSGSRTPQSPRRGASRRYRAAVVP